LKIKVIKTSVEKIKTYFKLNVVFRNLETDKVDGRNILSFVDKDVYAALKDAQKDDVYELSEITNDKGYPQVTSATKLDASEGVGATSSPAKSGATPAPRSNFETPEERAERQKYIIRQSSLERAIENLSIGAKAPLDPSAITTLARVFEDFVLGKPSGMAAIAAMQDDIPEAK
jgi:hypothetical protein